MNKTQGGILSEENVLSRYLSFSIAANSDPIKALESLVEYVDAESIVVGIGQSLVDYLGKEINGLCTMKAQSFSSIDVPSTPAALWCWLRGTDRGELFHRSRYLETLLSTGFELSDVIDSFSHDKNRDLSGYEDGTENPIGEEAKNVAILNNSGKGMDGGSFVVVQQWLHDFELLNEMTTKAKDDVIGRHIKDNEEFDDAPESAHVKRSAQESFNPEAFILRRSMPWADVMDGGLVFIAFATSFKPFEMIFDRMLGKDDAISDGLFTFTKPITGAYYWCPPVRDGKLDLRQLGLN